MCPGTRLHRRVLAGIYDLTDERAMGRSTNKYFTDRLECRVSISPGEPIYSKVSGMQYNRCDTVLVWRDIIVTSNE